MFYEISSNGPRLYNYYDPQVCSEWIGSGISRDINDVRRIQQMLATSLGKISSEEARADQIYSESAYTLESLAVLKAWAKVCLILGCTQF